MARRKKPATQHEEAPQPSKLLSLPPEVRDLIWKAAIEACPVLLYERRISNSTPAKVEALGCQSLSPNDNGLSWLRTSRQIYTEAQPLLAHHLTLTIRNGLVLAAFVTRSPKFNLDPSTLRHLALCLKVVVTSDLRDGFLICKSRFINRGWTRPISHCRCADCFHWKRNGGAREKLPSLQQLSLVINFTCKGGQGNHRPVVGTFADGRPRKGRLYRPKNPPLLSLKNSPAILGAYAGNFCAQNPLALFQGMKIELVVRYNRDSILHNVENVCPHPRDRCWCIGRSIDEESLRFLEGKITRRLLGA